MHTPQDLLPVCIHSVWCLLFIYLFVIYLFSNLLPLLAATRIQCRQYVTQLYKKTLQHKNTRLNTVDINVQFTGSVNMWLKCIQNAFFIIIVFSCVILWKKPNSIQICHCHSWVCGFSFAIIHRAALLWCSICFEKKILCMTINI